MIIATGDLLNGWFINCSKNWKRVRVNWLETNNDRVSYPLFKLNQKEPSAIRFFRSFKACLSLKVDHSTVHLQLMDWINKVIQEVSTCWSSHVEYRKTSETIHIYMHLKHVFSFETWYRKNSSTITNAPLSKTPCKAETCPSNSPQVRRDPVSFSLGPFPPVLLAVLRAAGSSKIFGEFVDLWTLKEKGRMLVNVYNLIQLISL